VRETIGDVQSYKNFFNKLAGMRYMDDLKQIQEKVTALLLRKPIVLLAIDGYGGSGKSTLARKIQNEFSGSVIITLDDFVTSTVSGPDRRRVLSQVLLPLSGSKSAQYQRFDWHQEILTDWITVKPEGLIIIEGVSVLKDDFHSYYDFRVWIDCPPELASKRGMERDRNIYKVNNDQKWEEIWIKADQEYAKTEPWKHADLIIKAFGL